MTLFKTYPSKDKSLMLSTCSLLVITFFVFGPIDYYIANKGEIWFQLRDILVPILFCALISLILLYLVLLISPPKIIDFVIYIYFGAGIAMYLQGNFMNPAYGILNGAPINWDKYRVYGILNLFIWILWMVLPFIISHIKGKELTSKIIKYTSLFVICIQIVTLVILLIASGGSKSEYSTDSHVVTTKDLFTFSSDQNVLIYVLDTFDAKYLDQLIDSEPHWAEKTLRDFTYYTNTLGSYPTTKGALPQILTGEWFYNEESFSQYIEKAWDDTRLYDTMKQAGYDIGIYTNQIYIESEQSNNLVNVMSKEDANLSAKPSNVSGLTTLFYKMVAFKYLPHYLKPYFYTYTGDLDQFRENQIYNASNDFLFYKMMLTDGIEVQENKVFKFCHLLGAHQPYKMNATAEQVAESTVLEQCKGSFYILTTLLNKLKQENIYDNATIIIMADHGDPSTLAQNPLLLIKDRFETGDFNISQAPVSYDDLRFIFQKSSEGELINEYIKTSIYGDRERFYCYYDWATDGSWDKDNLPPITKYISIANAKDFPVSKKCKKIRYDGKGNPLLPSYSYDSKIIFNEAKENPLHFSNFELYGYSQSEGSSAWSLGKSSCLEIPLIGLPKNDLTININFSSILTPNQRLKIYVENTLICDELSKSLSRTYTIPKTAITEKELQLRFEYPDSNSPAALGIGDDSRILAFSFKDITISENSN